jgi:RNA 2',3'-cyclic 3'-phosphodiesterase
MRLFISIDLPQTVIDECIRIQKIVHSYRAIKGKVTDPTQLHSTLLFLGETSAEDTSGVIEKLNQITFAPCLISLSSLNVNSWIHPHILWITLHAPRLENLTNHMRIVLGQHDTRPLKPHITLMRIKEPTDKLTLKKLVHNVEIEPLEWTITKFCLYESVLSREGSLYKQLAVFPSG